MSLSFQFVPLQALPVALTFIRYGFAVAVFLQALEELCLSQSPVRSLLIKAEKVGAFYAPIPGLGSPLIPMLRILLSVTLLFSPGVPLLWVLMFLLNLASSLRFFGSANGGSDCMTQVIGVGLMVASFSRGDQGLKTVAIYWIAIQSVLSYFLPGLRKARNQDWWSGQGLLGFISNSRVSVQPIKSFLMRFPALVKALSWSVLGYELLFPLVLVSKSACVIFLLMGIVFHFGVFLIFGLNRFFWIWIASYPAIYFIASRI